LIARRLAGLAGLAVLTAACTSLQAPAPEPTSADRDARLQALSHWQLRGRVAYKDPDGGGGQASLRWDQADAVSRLRLAGPFGAGAVAMTVEPGQVTVSDAQGERELQYLGPDALETLLRAQLGWSFPAAAARFWMLGIADPAAPAVQEFTAAGEPATLTQYGWRVEYERFAEFSGLELPVKLTMSGEHGRLRVVVTDWRFDRGAN
jgi:outer membrane lipoprotein LolB